MDPVTDRWYDLVEVVPPRPQAEQEGRASRDRLASQVEEKRNLRTRATVDQLSDRYLDQFDSAPSTLNLYRSWGIAPRATAVGQWVDGVHAHFEATSAATGAQWLFNPPSGSWASVDLDGDRRRIGSPEALFCKLRLVGALHWGEASIASTVCRGSTSPTSSEFTTNIGSSEPAASRCGVDAAAAAVCD